MPSAPRPYIIEKLKRILLQGTFGGPAAYDEPAVATFARSLVDNNNNLLLSQNQVIALLALLGGGGGGGPALMTFPIPNGVDFVTVTGLGLAVVPTKCLTTVMKNTGGLNLSANVCQDTLSEDGFTVDLGGVTDSANYVLCFLIS